MIENPTAVKLEPRAEVAELFRQAARRLYRGTKEALALLGLSDASISGSAATPSVAPDGAGAAQ